MAIMDWATRKVLSWRLSNTMDAPFCVEALEEALEQYGAPEIFNTDQGSQGEFKWSSQRWLDGTPLPGFSNPGLYEVDCSRFVTRP